MLDWLPQEWAPVSYPVMKIVLRMNHELLSWLRHVGYTISLIPTWIRKSCRRFDCVAPVFFRAKIVHSGNVSFLCLCTASSAITVCAQSVSGCWTCSVGRVLQSSEGSHPASRELKPCVPVEAFLSWGHLDGDGVLEQQLPGVPGHVNYYGLIPFDGMVVFPCMLRYCRLLQGPFSAGFLVFSQLGLQPSPGLTNADLATTAVDSVHHLGLLHHW